MSAFAMFSLKAPSLLAFDKERAEGNVATIYGMQRVPCDTHRREILDPVSPESLRPVFKSVLQQWQRGKALDAMTFLDGHYLLALDGTEKNDGERHAATHFVAQLRQDYPHLKCIVAEDSLRSNAPHIQTLHDHDLRSILGVKEGDHALLFHQVQVTEHAGGVTYYERHDRAAGLVHRFRLVNDVPLNASNAEVRVNCIEYWEMGAPKLQHFSWITDLRVSKRNVFRLMRGGRARWKIANETFNTLKNQGDHFEHNDGHGQQNLSVLFATIMMLAFLVDQTQQLCCALFRAVWAKLGSKRLLWEHMRALFYGYHLESMRELWEALWYGYERHRPRLITDTS